jgi:nitroreductase
MEFEQVIRKRRMIRKFDRNKQIPEKIIMKSLRNAHRAPSAGHTQIQEFIIVKDPAIQKKERWPLTRNVEEAPTLIVVCSNTSRSEKRYGRRHLPYNSL